MQSNLSTVPSRVPRPSVQRRPLHAARLSTAARRATTLAVMGALLFLAGCASPITARVTNFNQWPADAAGSSFAYTTRAGAPGGLEQQAYEGYVQLELEKLGLTRAAAGQPARFQAEVTVRADRQDHRFRQPVYQDAYVYRPAYRDAAGNLYPGFWGPDPFGPRYAGEREFVRTVQLSSLQVRLLDSRTGAPGKPAPVFESRASHEGDRADLPELVPFLVRAVFDDFPGQNGKVRVVRFDSKTGALLKP